MKFDVNLSGFMIQGPLLKRGGNFSMSSTYHFIELDG